MRIVQIIDSLEAGGAERMAINYANALASKIEFSGLIATRNEGLLLNQVNEKVSYLFLRKRKLLDFYAIFRLRKYLKTNKVNIIHAHSSSFFIAVLVKLTFPKVKIIWHDHYGISQDLVLRKNQALKLCSFFFNGSIAVNTALKNWAQSYLFCRNIIYFPNFIEDSPLSDENNITLNGVKGKRIICVANLRPQKNHDLLLDAATLIKNKFPEWTFHLVGKDFKDAYSAKLYQKVNTLNLNQTVFFYGAINNTKSALIQAEIAVLPSLSEGLPLAILEYGLYKLAVVATNVGEIPKIITSEKLGLIVESNNAGEFAAAVEKFINDEVCRNESSSNLHTKVKQIFSEEIIINEYLLWIKSFSSFTNILEN
jgi:glycosyltransferase involved in cell wall biosynthesis